MRTFRKGCAPSKQVRTFEAGAHLRRESQSRDAFPDQAVFVPLNSHLSSLASSFICRFEKPEERSADFADYADLEFNRRNLRDLRISRLLEAIARNLSLHGSRNKKSRAWIFIRTRLRICEIYSSGAVPYFAFVNLIIADQVDSFKIKKILALVREAVCGRHAALKAAVISEPCGSRHPSGSSRR
jgi:hypothetical protein